MFLLFAASPRIDSARQSIRERGAGGDAGLPLCFDPSSRCGNPPSSIFHQTAAVLSRDTAG
jgi:hypothetical protein